MKLLRDRIDEAMRRHPQLSQADIARATGVKTPSVADWMNGKTKSLKGETARLAAALFGCDQNWIGQGVGTPSWIDKSNAPTPIAPSIAKHAPQHLATALPAVLDALAGLPATRWASIRAQLDLLAGHPEMQGDVLAELQHLLASPGAAPGKRQVNG